MGTLDIAQLFQQCLEEQTLVLVPVLVIFGFIIKKTPNVPNWLIPWVLLVLGIVGGIALVGPSVSGVIQGILATGLAVFGHQLVKQTKERQKETKADTETIGKEQIQEISA